MSTQVVDWQTILSISGFAILGALGRYGCSFLPQIFNIPMGTVLVNLLGSFLLGFLTAFCVAHPLPPSVKTGLSTGFLGAFTTFSTFSVENATLIQDQATFTAGLNMIGQVVGGVACALLGLHLGARWFQP